MTNIVINLDSSDDDEENKENNLTTTTTTTNSLNKNANSYTNTTSVTPPTKQKTTPFNKVARNGAATLQHRRAEMLANIHEKRLFISSYEQPLPKQNQIEPIDVNNVNNNKPSNIQHKQSEVSNKSTDKIKTNESSKVPLSVSNDLRNQLASIRKRKHETFRNEKLSKKSLYTLRDIQNSSNNEKENRMHFASLPTTDNTNNRSKLHTINNTFKDPENIGRKALELSNKFRQENRKPPMRWHQELYKIGVEHSKNMADGKVAFGHDGFDDRAKRFPFSQRKAGENVAMNNMDANVAEVAVKGWIDSKGHRENLLADFNTCAIGVYQSSDGKWYLTQLFAQA